jgi:hypothetical protein
MPSRGTPACAVLLKLNETKSGGNATCHRTLLSHTSAGAGNAGSRLAQLFEHVHHLDGGEGGV